MNAFAPRDPDDIGVAILGAGRMGQTHVRNIAAIPNAHVAVVADPNGDAAERGRLLARAKRASTNPAEAIHDPDVEAVVIVTPTNTHAMLIEEALRAGKAIWSEKPIAQEIGETARVVDIWRATGLPVQIGFMRRFDPGYVRAKALIDSGALGRIEQFRALSRDTNPPPLEFLLTCGGSFLDMAVHDFDLARFLVGEVEEVTAWASVLFDDRFAKADDWDTSVAMLRFRNGALGVVETARHSTWGYDIRTEVAGALAKVVIDGGQKTPATISRESGWEGDLFESFPDRFEEAYRRQFDAFFADLAAGRAPAPGPDDALETLRVAVAATESWRKGRPVRLDEVPTTG
ncbi:MAG TPA: Gfo/Idh/MocA family oxidoreductase [Patescibacteria group bacterium]|nr:Gfo/Idh/MocA family oxidoreductase [Patescibacteria group bacterium]